MPNPSPTSFAGQLLPRRAFGLLVAAIAFGLVTLGYSFVFDSGLTLAATVGLGALIYLLLTARNADTPIAVPDARLAVVVVIAMAGAIIASRTGVFAQIDTPQTLLWHGALTAAVGLLAVCYLLDDRLFGRLTLPMLLLAWMGLAMWTIRCSPNPPIDVFVHHQLSAEGLLHGQNPYAMTFPDIYEGHSAFVNDQMVQNGRTTYGFAYPPINLIATLPSYLAFGDVRYAYAVCIAGAAWLLACVSRAPLARIGTLLFLLQPNLLSVVDASWTEPPSYVFVGLIVLLASRGRTLGMAVAAGCLLASKQYNLCLLPGVLLLVPRPLFGKAAIRWVVIWVVTIGVIHLPWMAVNPQAYFRSMFWVHRATPFRFDSISWMSALGQDSRHEPWPNEIGLFAALVVSVASLKLLRPGVGSFLLSSAASLATFFLMTRGFLNYYTMVTTLIAGCFVCLADSLSQRTPDPIVEHEQRPEHLRPVAPAAEMLVEPADERGPVEQV